MSHGWTPARRAAQARLIRQWRPWSRSTGPKSPEGRTRSSLNAVKHGAFGREARELRALLSELLT